MKNNPLKKGKAQSFKVKEPLRIENKTLELFQSQTPFSPEFSSRGIPCCNSRSVSNPKNLKSKMKEDISLLLKAAIQIRKSSEDEACELKSQSPPVIRTKILDNTENEELIEFNYSISMKDIGSVPCL